MGQQNQQSSKAVWRNGFSFNQELKFILISAVISILSAMIIGVVALDLLSYGLRRQLFILFTLSCGLGTVCYFLLTLIPPAWKAELTSNERGLRIIIRKTFLAVFFLFPITLILYRQIVEMLTILRTGQSSDFIGWLPQGTDSRAFFVPVFILCCVLFLALFLAGRKQSIGNFSNNLPDLGVALLIFGFSLAVRLPIIYLINTQPVSDFMNINNDALLISEGAPPVNLYATTHVAVTLIYGYLYRIFGTDLAVIRTFHIVVYSFAGLFIYLAGKEIFGSKLWAAAAALLLVSWPSLAFYSNVSTPEHLFILAECTLIFVVAGFFKNGHKTENKANRLKHDLIWFAAIGLLLGISGLFRPFGELFLVAFTLTYLLFMQKRKLTETVIALLCMFIPFWLIANLPTAIIKYYQGEPPKNVRPCNLLVGMNFEVTGQYNTPDRELCTRLRDESADEAAFTGKVMEVVWERLKSQKDGLLQFVDRKFAVLWANSNGILFWALGQVSGGDESFLLDLARKVNLVDFAIMFMITITCLVGTAMAFFKGVKPVILFCLLSFFGFNLMEIPLELQTRYRTVIMPVMIFFACWTLATIYGSANNSQPFDSAKRSSELTGS